LDRGGFPKGRIWIPFAWPALPGERFKKPDAGADRPPASGALPRKVSGRGKPTSVWEEIFMNPVFENRPVLLVVSFGTSYNASREATIGAMERALQAAYPEYAVRRAFTSRTVIRILKEREGLEIDGVEEAMERLAADGVREVVVQPTHMMEGCEYDEMVRLLRGYQGRFASLKIGTAMLSADGDYDAMVKILAQETKPYDTNGTAIVWMGHGTQHRANATYAKLQRRLADAGYGNHFIGTVEAKPTAEDVLAAVRETGATRVVLLPLMIVAGDHAINDMAGEDEGAWKTIFTRAGYEVVCVMKGLGQYPGIWRLAVEHAGRAIAGK